MPADLLSGKSVETIDKQWQNFVSSRFIEALFIHSSPDVESTHVSVTGLRKYGIQCKGHGSVITVHTTRGLWLRAPEHTYMPGRHGRLPLILALQGGEGNSLSKLSSNTRLISELSVWLRYLYTHLQRACVTTFSMLLFFFRNLLLSRAFLLT